jgi:hypothetical protein
VGGGPAESDMEPAGGGPWTGEGGAPTGGPHDTVAGGVGQTRFKFIQTELNDFKEISN